MALLLLVVVALLPLAGVAEREPEADGEEDEDPRGPGGRWCMDREHVKSSVRVGDFADCLRFIVLLLGLGVTHEVPVTEVDRPVDVVEDGEVGLEEEVGEFAVESPKGAEDEAGELDEGLVEDDLGGDEGLGDGVPVVVGVPELHEVEMKLFFSGLFIDD